VEFWEELCKTWKLDEVWNESEKAAGHDTSGALTASHLVEVSLSWPGAEADHWPKVKPLV